MKLLQLFRPRASGNAKPAEWLFEALGGEKNTSGVRINEDTALNISAVWACVRLISESVASLPLILYRPDGEGRERVTDHPLYRVLHDAPNSDMTSMTFRTTLMAHVLTWGNAYAELRRGSSGLVREMWPLRPDAVKLTEDKSGRAVYEVKFPDQSMRNISPRNMLHIHGLGYDGYNGYSPIRRAREALGLASATEMFGGAFFGNGINAGGILEHPGKLSDVGHENLRNSFREQFSGASNARGMMILEEGMKWTQVSIPPDDAQFLETRRFQVEEVARWYAVPPHMIQDLQRATFSNIEHQSIDFVVHTLRPWLIRWEQELRRKLLGINDQILNPDGLYIEHLVDALLRGDTKTRYEAYKMGREGGWLSVNDIRRKENEPEIEGGDEYLVPLNMRPASESSAANLLRDTIQDQAIAEKNAIMRAVERYTDDYDRLAQWIARYMQDRTKRLVNTWKLSDDDARRWIQCGLNRLKTIADAEELKSTLDTWVQDRVGDYYEVAK